MNQRYYRTQLKPIQQKAYDNLVEAIRTFQKTVCLPLLPKDELTDTLEAVLNDYPEFFYYQWDDGVHNYYYIHSDHLEYPLSYDFSPSAVRKILKKTDQIADVLIAQAKRAGCKTDLAIAAYLHDYLTDHISYTKKARSPKRNHCIIGPLINRECVCEGYAKTYLYLLNRAGIPAIYVCGKTLPDTSGRHAWNMVKIGSKWYHVDVTWDSNGKKVKGTWEHFMLSASEITQKKHILPTNVKLPPSVCTMTLNRSRRLAA